MVRWGILGLGRAANSFANAIKEVENAKLIAIASLSKNKINSFQKKFKSLNSKNKHLRVFNPRNNTKKSINSKHH